MVWTDPVLSPGGLHMYNSQFLGNAYHGEHAVGIDQKECSYVQIVQDPCWQPITMLELLLKTNISLCFTFTRDETDRQEILDGTWLHWNGASEERID